METKFTPSVCKGLFYNPNTKSAMEGAREYKIDLIEAIRNNLKLRGVSCDALSLDVSDNYICGAYNTSSRKPCACPNAGNYNQFINTHIKPLFDFKK